MESGFPPLLLRVTPRLSPQPRRWLPESLPDAEFTSRLNNPTVPRASLSSSHNNPVPACHQFNAEAFRPAYDMLRPWLNRRTPFLPPFLTWTKRQQSVNEHRGLSSSMSYRSLLGRIEPDRKNSLSYAPARESNAAGQFLAPWFESAYDVCQYSTVRSHRWDVRVPFASPAGTIESFGP